MVGGGFFVWFTNLLIIAGFRMVGGGYFVWFTKDFIVGKQLVELFKFIPRSEKGLENLVNGEEDESEPKKDVGVEGNEGVDSRMRLFIQTIVTAVRFDPKSIINWVKLGLVQVGMVLSTLICL